MNAPAFDDALLSRIEDAGLNASAPPQQRWVDGWLVRFSPGKAQRARCINAVAEGRMPLEQRLALCEALYRQCGLRLLVRVTPFSRPAAFDDWLAQRGFEAYGATRVMVNTAMPGDPPASTTTCRDEKIGVEAYAHIIGEFRGTDADGRLAHAQRLLNSPVPYHGRVLRDRHGQILACAQMAIEGEIVGLYDVHTAAAARGQGLAAGLCAQLLHEARHLGARVAYLQVEADNPARRLYARLGFVDAYGYHYRARPAAAT